MLELKLDPAFQVLDTPLPFSLSAHAQTRVDAIWEAEKAIKGDALYDGVIFSAQEWNSQKLLGQWRSYRLALAVYRDPTLAAELKMFPVTVNGLIRAGDRVLFGRRAMSVAQYPGYIELVPSGGLDPEGAGGPDIDYKAVLLRELLEETGIENSYVRQVIPLALITHTDEPTREICLEIHLDSSVPESVKLITGEYTEFFWVVESEIQAFLRAYGPSVVPLTTTLWSLYSQ